MKHQEQLPTIWDVSLKSSAHQQKQPTTAKETSRSLKEVFLTLWGSVKRKPAA